MERLEENILIADFMGFEEHKGSYLIPHEENIFWCPDVDLEFNNNWLWLLPVIRKIGGKIGLNKNNTLNQGIKIILESVMYNVDINQVYKSVIEFINEYNKYEAEKISFKERFIEIRDQETSEGKYNEEIRNEQLKIKSNEKENIQ